MTLRLHVCVLAHQVRDRDTVTVTCQEPFYVPWPTLLTNIPLERGDNDAEAKIVEQCAFMSQRHSIIKSKLTAADGTPLLSTWKICSSGGRHFYTPLLWSPPLRAGGFEPSWHAIDGTIIEGHSGFRRLAGARESWLDSATGLDNSLIGICNLYWIPKWESFACP